MKGILAKGRARFLALTASWMAGWLVVLLAACQQAEPKARQRESTPEIMLMRAALEAAPRGGVDGARLEHGGEVAIGLNECPHGERCFSCYQCHGVRGEGSAVAGIPRLAGQSYEYLLQSLQSFASGERVSPTMQSVAATLSAQQVKDVSAYFAAVRPAVALNHAPQSMADLIAAGRAIALEGSTEPVIQACTLCHGGGGNEPPGPDYPYLSGQHAAYVERQLRAFRSGERRGSLGIMELIAGQMTDSDIRAVSQYYSSLAIQDVTHGMGPDVL